MYHSFHSPLFKFRYTTPTKKSQCNVIQTSAQPNPIEVSDVHATGFIKGFPIVD